MLRSLRACFLRVRNTVEPLIRDRSAASAIEFAFLAPILISIYVSSFEITEGYNTAGKVLKAAGTVADVVARQPTVDKAFLSEMVDTAEATIAPFDAFLHPSISKQSCASRTGSGFRINSAASPRSIGADDIIGVVLTGEFYRRSPGPIHDSAFIKMASEWRSANRIAQYF